MTPGVEVSTGPLGQGLSNAVGLAAAEKHLAAVFNKPGFNVIDNYTYVICGDGCLQEGITSEASSLAGHLQLGKLIVLYDDNHITIDGDTEISFTEDVLKRYESYGWHTIEIKNGDTDFDAILNAVHAAKQVTDKPSMIKIRTTIGLGSSKQGLETCHGSPLGAPDVANVKKHYGFDPEKFFQVDDDVYSLYSAAAAKGTAAHTAWKSLFEQYKSKFPSEAGLLQRYMNKELPAGWESVLPTYKATDADKATRNLSEICLNALAPILPELFGGSADLTGSNLTHLKQGNGEFQAKTPLGRNFKFGVREHAMAAICNGLHAYGGILPYCATFLNFVGYAAGAVRISALSHHQVIYVMTHDSIGLGEDGPTHQPIETLSYLRAMPRMLTIRPADGNETSGAYIQAVKYRTGPSTLCFTRQAVPQLQGSSAEGVAKGAYILNAYDATNSSNPDIVLIGTGSEVSLCVAAAKLLEGVLKVRVVSAPCLELFDAQSRDYAVSVLPVGVPVLSVELACSHGWHRYAHQHYGIDTYGASGPIKDLFNKFGFTADKLAEAAKKVAHHFHKTAPALPCCVEKLF